MIGIEIFKNYRDPICGKKYHHSIATKTTIVPVYGHTTKLKVGRWVESRLLIHLMGNAIVHRFLQITGKDFESSGNNLVKICLRVNCEKQ